MYALHTLGIAYSYMQCICYRESRKAGNAHIRFAITDSGKWTLIITKLCKMYVTQCNVCRVCNAYSTQKLQKFTSYSMQCKFFKHVSSYFELVVKHWFSGCNFRLLLSSMKRFIFRLSVLHSLLKQKQEQDYFAHLKSKVKAFVNVIICYM